jgi:predicted RNase H-like HicB family nuclease
LINILLFNYPKRFSLVLFIFYLRAKGEENMKKNDKNIFIVVTYIIKKENDQYVAVCPEFDVSSFGDTVEEANKNLKEAIMLYLEGIDELKIRDQIFKEKSIQTSQE